MQAGTAVVGRGPGFPAPNPSLLSTWPKSSDPGPQLFTFFIRGIPLSTNRPRPCNPAPHPSLLSPGLTQPGQPPHFYILANPSFLYWPDPSLFSATAWPNEWLAQILDLVQPYGSCKSDALYGSGSKSGWCNVYACARTHAARGEHSHSCGGGFHVAGLVWDST